MHLDDERVQRLLHGELGSAEAETRFHLESCAPCRDLVAGARVEEDRILALLSEVDHPVATLDPRIVLAERNASRGHWGRRAAAAILGVAIAGAAYALPGSPLPAALDRLLGTGSGVPDSAPATQAERASAPPAGIAVPATNGLVIQLMAEGQVAIELTDEEEVAVRAAHLLGRLDADRVEALLDRPVALVGRQDPLPRRDEGFRNLFQAGLGHGRHSGLLRSLSLGEIIPSTELS